MGINKKLITGSSTESINIVDESMSDKTVVTSSSHSPGVQPGKWRLILGTCAVGARSRSRTPHNQVVSQKGRGEKEAELVDLTGKAGGGEREIE